MSIASSSFSAGYTGSRVISGTSPVTGKFRGFVVNENCVVSAILDKDGNSILSSLGLSGVTLNTGVYICVPDGNWISSITLTSGSIVAYNE
jgi:hypothetical protein